MVIFGQKSQFLNELLGKFIQKENSDTKIFNWIIAPDLSMYG